MVALMCYKGDQVFSALFAKIDSTYLRTVTKPTLIPTQ